MKSSQDLRTPMAKARGWGATGHGTEHLIQQRALAACLLVGFIYSALSILFTTNLSYGAMVDWFHNPLNAAVMALIVSAGAWHFRLGIQVVIEDYIHKAATKMLLILGTSFIAALMAMVGIFTILKVFLGA